MRLKDLFCTLIHIPDRFYGCLSKQIIISGIIFLFITTVSTVSCKKNELLPDRNNQEMLPELSGYKIFQGTPADLIPAADYELYELSSPLFTDYAEKQRLIKIPGSANLTATGNGLPDFPEGTILVKTFYYYLDKRVQNTGRKIIETRVMIKNKGLWNVGTYQWNDGQTEAYLIKSGAEKTVNYIDENGRNRAISYHIPGNRECATCHNSKGRVIPIGPKIRNLNFEVLRNGRSQNQLTYLQTEGIFAPVNPAAFGALPDYKDPAFSLEQRARAYLDINCAHCHNSQGFASSIRYRLDYETSLEHSKIKAGKNAIHHFMEKGLMPKIGTTVVDEEGVALIKKYLDTL